MFVEMSIWIFLAIFSISVTSLLFVLLKPKRDTINRGIKLGILLLVVDFIFENLGLIFGWKTGGSIFGIGAVPIEVTVIAFCAGVTYAMLFARKFVFNLAVASSLLFALIGAGVEAILLGLGVFIYYSGWTSYHALISYFIAFLLMHKLNSRL